MRDINDLKVKYKTLLKRKSDAEEKIQFLHNDLEKVKTHLDHLYMARELIASEAEKAQANFQNRINSLVTMVIRSVFANRDLEFKINLERKANRLEARPILFEGNEAYDDIKRDTGGSIVDLISFALRIVLWSMQSPKTRPVFILDEPFKAIGKGRMLYRTGAMLQEISRKLNLQIIIITHEPQLQEIADKAFFVDLKKGQTIITEKRNDSNKTEEKEAQTIA